MEAEPLLPPGMHDFELSQISNHFLSEFPNSVTRSGLIKGLKKFIAALAEIGIPIEVWVDGSFTTRKENPNDIDLVFFASENDVDGLSGPKRNTLFSLTNRLDTRYKFGCDVFFSVSDDENLRSYWRGWYGFDRNEMPKGIARIRINA